MKITAWCGHGANGRGREEGRERRVGTWLRMQPMEDQTGAPGDTGPDRVHGAMSPIGGQARAGQLGTWGRMFEPGEED